MAGKYAVILEDDIIEFNGEVSFELAFLQNDSADVPQFPETLRCLLQPQNGKEIEVTARREDGGAPSTAPRDTPFVKQKYRFRLPPELQGTIIVRLVEVKVARFVVESMVARSPAEERVAAAAQSESYTGSKADYTDLDSLFSLYQPYLKNISAYEPMYFLVGSDPENSKFQISFKYRFINPDSSFAKNFPWVTGFHFGYTQTSFWDLSSDSAPFADTSYRPELFYLTKNLLDSDIGPLKGVFLQGGVQHHSNGRGGEFSRSSNYVYAWPSFIFFNEDNQFGLGIFPKFWAYMNNDDTTNPDLMDYQGYFEIDAKAGFADSVVLGAKYRYASEGHSYELDLSYPLHSFFNNALDLYLYLQYSDVLAESLLDYSDRTQVFRLGLAIVR